MVSHETNAESHDTNFSDKQKAPYTPPKLVTLSTGSTEGNDPNDAFPAPADTSDAGHGS